MGRRATYRGPWRPHGYAIPARTRVPNLRATSPRLTRRSRPPAHGPTAAHLLEMLCERACAAAGLKDLRARLIRVRGSECTRPADYRMWQLHRSEERRV